MTGPICSTGRKRISAALRCRRPKHASCIVLLSRTARRRASIQLDFRTGQGVCDLAYFGLTPESTGGGLGRWLLCSRRWPGSLGAGFRMASASGSVVKMTVHTNSIDHPAALGDLSARSASSPVRHRDETAPGGARIEALTTRSSRRVVRNAPAPSFPMLLQFGLYAAVNAIFSGRTLRSASLPTDCPPEAVSKSGLEDTKCYCVNPISHPGHLAF